MTWPQRTDKAGEFVRKYCPELRDMPDKVSCTAWLLAFWNFGWKHADN